MVYDVCLAIVPEPAGDELRFGARRAGPWRRATSLITLRAFNSETSRSVRRSPHSTAARRVLITSSDRALQKSDVEVVGHAHAPGLRKRSKSKLYGSGFDFIGNYPGRGGRKKRLVVSRVDKREREEGLGE